MEVAPPFLCTPSHKGLRNCAPEVKVPAAVVCGHRHARRGTALLSLRVSGIAVHLPFCVDSVAE
jgi:hypothetical protein